MRFYTEKVLDKILFLSKILFSYCVLTAQYHKQNLFSKTTYASLTIFVSIYDVKIYFIIKFDGCEFCTNFIFFIINILYTCTAFVLTHLLNI